MKNVIVVVQRIPFKSIGSVSGIEGSTANPVISRIQPYDQSLILHSALPGIEKFYTGDCYG